MLTANETNFHISTFMLMGIPGLETQHIWISIPVFFSYVLALLGNSVLLYVMQTDRSLHEPMYQFLSMLTITDLVLMTATVPKMLGIFWFESKEIHFDLCLTQMFFIHSFTDAESGILLAMALDRYIAICNPLRYSMILTGPVVAKVGLGILIRAIVLLVPHPIIMKSLPYYQTNMIHHTYCEFMAVVKQSCADTSVLRGYSLIMAFLTGGVDMICIMLSYALIIKAVSKLRSMKAGMKAFSTCGSHLCVILIFYTTSVFSYLTHRFGDIIPPHIHIIVANMYLLIPPFINPVIYGVRTKRIREWVLQMVSYKTTGT